MYIRLACLNIDVRVYIHNERQLVRPIEHALLKVTCTLLRNMALTDWQSMSTPSRPTSPHLRLRWVHRN